MAFKSSGTLASPLRLYMLGSWRLEHENKTLRLATRKIESLLAFLALYPQAHAREKLAALLWGDVTDAQARGSLRKALTLLRVALGDAIVLADRQTVQLNPDYSLWTDVREFERVTNSREWKTLDRLLETSQQLDALYRGELLADLYDDWIFARRREFRERLEGTLLALTQGFRAQSEYAHAISLAQRILQLDPANERAHQHLMFCYVGLGDRHAALKQYEQCVGALELELGVQPARETQALHQWIQQFSGDRAATEALATNVPIPLSSFIGRQQQTAALKQFLKSDTRLVTLTGPGGSGKTRLAIQTAMDLICAGGTDNPAGLEFGDGVWWVELAALTDATNVIPQVAKTFGVRESGQEPLLNTLQTWLQAKQLLLILDNCEHVLEPAAQFANELLKRAPQIKILTTSREALRIAGEQVYPVPTLNVPRRAASSYLELLNEFEGIRLFVERAQAVQPTFQLTEQNASAVAQICARLDGVPLALELAASRVKILSAQEIAARLDARFDLLEYADRAASPRHQTLRAVLDWSFDLLDEPERTLFRRMSIFAGGCTLDALQALMPDTKPSAALKTLTRLIDKSLVIPAAYGATTRYGMLETIQAYAREKLRAANEFEPCSTQHRAFFVEWAERAERQVRGTAQQHWLAQFDAELDNVRAALEWAVARDVEAGLRLAGALEWFWNLRGLARQALQWLRRLLEQDTASVAPHIRARALVAGANLLFWTDIDRALAEAWDREAIALYRASPVRMEWNLGYALALYGEILRERQQEQHARLALDEAWAIGETLGEEGKWICAWAAMSLSGLGDAAAVRRARVEQSVALFRALGDHAQLPVVLARAAWFYMGQAEHTLAQASAQEGLELTQEIGDSLGLAWCNQLLGDLAQARDDRVSAAVYYTASLERFQQLGNEFGAQAALEGLRRAQ